MSRLSSDVHTTFSENILTLLNDRKIFTVTDFVKEECKVIGNATNISFKEILEIKQDLLKRYSPKPRNGFTYYNYLLENSAIIPTGIQSLDTLLDGGLSTGNIYEIYGLPSSGKTFFCLILTKYISNNNQKICYLDTKQNFSAKKIKYIFKKNENLLQMNEIFVKRISTKYELINSLFELKSDIENGFTVKLIIIDSLANLFLNSEDIEENNKLLTSIASTMRFMASELNITFLVTNLTTLWRESNMFESSDSSKEKIFCGNYWKSIPNVKLQIENLDDSFKITLISKMCSSKISSIMINFNDL